MKIFRQKVFKKGKDNVYQYTLINNHDIEIKILTLGGIITDILMPDRFGRKENIVIGWHSLSDYLDDDFYAGSIIGRTAGRIADGKAAISGKEYKFNINDAEVNQIHGGIEGFNKRVWKDNHVEDYNKVSLILEYRSNDGEEGYPGNVDLKVIYSLNNANEFSIEYYGKSDKDTLLNMTNHNFFNLSGNFKDDIFDEILTVNASNAAKIRNDGALSGEIFNVENTPFDFRSGKAIGDDISAQDEQIEKAGGYYHPFILDGSDACIKLEDYRSGRKLEISTDSKAVIVYTTNNPCDKVLFNGQNLVKYDAVCLDTQNLPIGQDSKFVEDSLLLAGNEYRHKTIFKFSNIAEM